MTCCVALCGCVADNSARSPHLSALLPVALAALAQPPHPQRAAVLAISIMFSSCSPEQRATIAAAGFVRPAVSWLSSFLPVWRLQVLTAACRLARPPQLPLLTAVQSRLFIRNQEQAVKVTASCLFDAIKASELTLGELFDGAESAAAVAAHVVHLLARTSGQTLLELWWICVQLSFAAVNLKLLLDAGLLRPALFSRAWLRCARPDVSRLQGFFFSIMKNPKKLIESGMLSIMFVACADSDPGVVRDGMAALLDCVRAADRLDAAQLRPIILQACADALPIRRHHSRSVFPARHVFCQSHRGRFDDAAVAGERSRPGAAASAGAATGGRRTAAAHRRSVKAAIAASPQGC